MTRSTGVGSHPGSTQADLDEAVRVVWSEVSLPYVPEVPGRGAHASMVGRALAVVSDLAADLQPAGWRLVGVSGTSGVDQRRARSLLGQDLDTVEEHAQQHAGPVKVQLAGPWTLAASVERPRGDRVLADHGARRDLAQALAAGLGEHLADLRRRLPHVSTLLVQVDEPSLPAVLGGQVPTASGFGRHRTVDRPEAAAALSELVAVVREAGAEPLVHCCAREVPFDLLEHAGSPGLSVDLDVMDATAYDPLAAALEAGRPVHLGLVPSTRPAPGSTVPTVRSVTTRAERLLELLGAEPSDRLALTPACGLAGADQEWARGALGLVAEAAGALG